MQILRRLTRLVFYLKRHQTIFPGLPCLQRPKSWANPFGKMQILRLFYVDVLIV